MKRGHGDCGSQRRGSPSSNGACGGASGFGHERDIHGSNGAVGGAGAYGHKRSSPSRGPSWCPERQQLERGETGYNGDLALCASLNIGATLLWFPPQAFLVSDFLTPIPSGRLLTANSNPLPRLALQTPRSSTQPLSALVDTCLRLWHAGLWHRPSVKVSLCPACHTLVGVLSSNTPEAPLLFQQNSPLVRGFSWMREPLLSFSSPPPRGTSPIPLTLLFSLLLSFILPFYAGNFLVLLGV